MHSFKISLQHKSLFFFFFGTSVLCMKLSESTLIMLRMITIVKFLSFVVFKRKGKDRRHLLETVRTVVKMTSYRLLTDSQKVSQSKWRTELKRCMKFITRLIHWSISLSLERAMPTRLSHQSVKLTFAHLDSCTFKVVYRVGPTQTRCYYSNCSPSTHSDILRLDVLVIGCLGLSMPMAVIGRSAGHCGGHLTSMSSVGLHFRQATTSIRDECALPNQPPNRLVLSSTA